METAARDDKNKRERRDFRASRAFLERRPLTRRTYIRHRLVRVVGASLAAFVIFAQILSAMAAPRLASHDDAMMFMLCSGGAVDDATGATDDSAPPSKHCPACQALWGDAPLPPERSASVILELDAVAVLDLLTQDGPRAVALAAIPPPSRGPPSIA